MARNAIVVCEVFLDMSLISRDIFLDPVEFEQRIHIKTTRQMIQTPRATANPKTKATQALKKNIRFLCSSEISEIEENKGPQIVCKRGFSGPFI